MPRHHRHRTKLAHGTGIAKNHAIQQTPFDVGQGDAPKNLPATRAQDHGGLLFFIALGLHEGNELAGNERKGDKHRGQHDARDRKNDLDVMRLQPGPKPTLRAKHQDIDQTRHHRRHRKRQIHQGGEQGLAFEFKLGDGPCSTDTEHQVQRHSDGCDQQGEFDGRPCIGFFESLKECINTFAQCLGEHRRQGQDEEQTDEDQGNANQGAA